MLKVCGGVTDYRNLHPVNRFALMAGIFPIAMLLTRCGEPQPVEVEHKCLEVEVSAYNSLPYQTRPGTRGDITAWGDTLREDIPSVAVSRDLIDSGLVYGARVLIEGFQDTFVVNDKMNRRYSGAIDIYMQADVDRALEFGRQRLVICLLESREPQGG